jgi:hypothetical protein
MRHAYAAQQRYPLAQAGFVVGNLAAHRCLGNRRHFGFAPGGIGDFVYALNVDQGGVHVKGNQLEIRQAQGGGDALKDETEGVRV